MRRLLLPLFVVLALVAGAGIVASTQPDTAEAACNPQRPRCTPVPTIPPGPTGTPSPTVTPPPPSGTIGYVGCSNSAASVDGYHLDGGTAMWPFIRNYGSGTVKVWATNVGGAGDQWWNAFSKQQGLNPATTFWFQLCAKVDELDEDNVVYAEQVIAEIQNRVPGAVVYVSALNDFEQTCVICGPTGPEEMREAVAALVASGDLQGPDLGTLSASQVTSDTCHPNTAGKQYLGESLLNFFG